MIQNKSRKVAKLSAALLCSLLVSQSAFSAIQWQEDFETDGDGSRYTASQPFNDGSSDHWQRTDGNDISNITGPYSNFSGSYFWAAEDVDDNGGNTQDQQSIAFNTIDITGLTNLTFKGLFAAGSENAPGASYFDSLDYIRVTYSVDGSTPNNGICFGYEDHGDIYNEPLGLDADCDGIADSNGVNRLGTALQEFSFSVPSGTSLDLSILVSMDGSSEEIAFDNFRIEDGQAAVADPEPTNYPSNVAATADSISQITSTWTDSVAGAQAPAAYLVMCGTSAPVLPVDGIAQADDADCSDGSGVINLAHGAGSPVSWAGLMPGTSYQFRVIPYTNSGVDIDYKTDSAPTPVTTSTLTVTGTAIPYNEDFNDCNTHGWTSVSEDADAANTWSCDAAGFMEVNAYGDSAPADDWLISPAIDLGAAVSPLLSFVTRTQYADSGIANPQVTLLYSTDYIGVGSASAANWSPLAFTAAAENSQTETPSGDVDISTLNGQSVVFFAIQYQSSGTSGGSTTYWRVDDFQIVEAPVADLQITEIWPGQAGSDVTEDWFEITNEGNADWVAADHGQLYYDDEFASAASAVQISGISRIDVGESAIVVIGAAGDETTFTNVWGSVVDLNGISVGLADGSGLGGSSDAVTLWLGTPTAEGVQIDSEAYTNADLNDGQSYDVDLAAYSQVGTPPEALATTVLGGANADVPAVGSPGNQGPFVDVVSPLVDTLSPADEATDVAIGSNLTITFDEPVQTNTGNISFRLMSDDSIVETFDVGVSAAVTVAANTVTIDPSADLQYSTAYYLLIGNTAISDLSGNAFAGIADKTSWNFTTEADICLAPASLISTIQGNTDVSPEEGQVHTIQAVVTGDFQGSGALNGFFVQEEDSDVDADPLTSEGILVYDANFGVDVSEGDLVRVTGTVDEFFGKTELTSITEIVVCDTSYTVASTPIALPVTAQSDYEAFEGMLVHMAADSVINDVDSLTRYGEIELASERLFVGTQLHAPASQAWTDHQAANVNKRLVMDDGRGGSYTSPFVLGLAANSPVREGDILQNVAGIMDYNYGKYRIQPISNMIHVRSPRSVAPTALGASLKVASFNVLNYFQTLNQRGAETPTELIRQQDKLVAAMIEMDADIIAIQEIENDSGVSLSALVTALNSHINSPNYASISVSGPIGTDAIMVGFIYNADTVVTQGSPAILDNSVDNTFIDTKNRPVVASSFIQLINGEQLTVAVAHLKSKGSDCDDVGDFDANDGQGNCNLTRTSAATAIANWLAADPTSSGDSDFLIVGDLNSYAMEDPIAALETAGYTNMVKHFHGLENLTKDFVDSDREVNEAGTLDYAMANESMKSQIVSTEIWSINSDESVSLDYKEDFKFSSTAKPADMYQADSYRSSDHDPIVVGIKLGTVFRDGFEGQNQNP